MPQLKQPLSLEDMGIEANVNKYCDKCEKWMKDLFQAIPRDTEAYSSVTVTVLNECREMEEEISSLCPSLLKILSPRLANEFAKLICDHSGRRRDAKSLFGDAAENISPCSAVFRSVLTRYVHKFDLRITFCKIGQLIMIQNLDSVPGLLELRLCIRFPHQSALLTSMIRHLKNLQIFVQRCDCTDEIILQLRLHCPHLTQININYSRDVTNASVEHLMQLRKLKFLHFRGTQIDDEQYGLLLTELPDIAYVDQRGKGDILRHIPVERLDKITHVRGRFRDIDTLRLKCPNTININLCQYSTDLSGLAAFLALRVLEISYLDYGKCNLNAVLRGIGHRLTSLKMGAVASVNIRSIVSLCPSLETLSLDLSSFSRLMVYPPFDPKLPHFRNLINLQIITWRGPPADFSFIRYYGSLRTIDIENISIFTVEFVREILILGTFTQLEVLHVEESSTGALTVEALQLLIRHCPHLKRIEGLRSCSLLHTFDVAKLKHGLLLQNFDLEIKTDTSSLS
jgi:hypothetical protein